MDAKGQRGALFGTGEASRRGESQEEREEEVHEAMLVDGGGGARWG